MPKLMSWYLNPMESVLSVLSEEIGERKMGAAQTEGVSEDRACTGVSAAQREVRVVARGRFCSQATSRSILIAAAVPTCCKWVFSRPR